MAEQVDIAVDLGAVPPSLPEIVTLRQFAASPPAAPPQIIEGVLHQGCKMVLGGTSKGNRNLLPINAGGHGRDGCSRDGDSSPAHARTSRASIRTHNAAAADTEQ
jgi:hypothetical protein